MPSTDFTISDVLAWARTKPADEGYDYFDPANCALCHFLRDTRRARWPIVTPAEGWRGGLIFRPRARAYPRELESPLIRGRTFGGLAAMLEALAPEPSIWISVDAYMSERVSA